MGVWTRFGGFAGAAMSSHSSGEPFSGYYAALPPPDPQSDPVHDARVDSTYKLSSRSRCRSLVRTPPEFREERALSVSSVFPPAQEAATG